MNAARILILGCGYAGSAIARLARERGLAVVVNVRSAERAAALAARGFEVLRRDALDASIAEEVDDRTLVVIGFPPDGSTDARIATHLAGAAAITYLSSTGVYGDHRGVVDDETPLPASDVATPRSALILAAEEEYRRVGATVLRCPGIYGPDRGLHVRVIRGEHRIPGDGTRFLSRIHVDDLARFVVPVAGAAGETFVVGDTAPAPQIEVVRFVCDTYGAPMPPFVPLESVHESLRGDRRVDSRRAVARLGVTFAYPSYREGMAPSATGLLQGLRR